MKGICNKQFALSNISINTYPIWYTKQEYDLINIIIENDYKKIKKNLKKNKEIINNLLPMNINLNTKNTKIMNYYHFIATPFVLAILICNNDIFLDFFSYSGSLLIKFNISLIGLYDNKDIDLAYWLAMYIYKLLVTNKNKSFLNDLQKIKKNIKILLTSPKVPKEEQKRLYECCKDANLLQLLYK